MRITGKIVVTRLALKVAQVVTAINAYFVTPEGASKWRPLERFDYEYWIKPSRRGERDPIRRIAFVMIKEFDSFTSENWGHPLVRAEIRIDQWGGEHSPWQAIEGTVYLPDNEEFYFKVSGEINHWIKICER